jgi:hypothetical protein
LWPTDRSSGGYKPVHSGIFSKSTLAPAFIGAGLCLLILRSGFFIGSGFLSLFFLVPLGFIAFKYNFQTAWAAVLLAITGNMLLSILFLSARDIPLQDIFPDLLYFAVMVSLFAWIITPPPGFSAKLSGSMRFIAGSCAGSLMFAVVFLKVTGTPAFTEYVNIMVEALASLYQTSDVVQNALMESLTAELVISTVKSVILRGGSLASCIMLFFFSRLVSFMLVRFSRFSEWNLPHRENGIKYNSGSLKAFHVSPAAIWVLSAALFLVVVARIAKLEIPEIIFWNVLILCAILYLAQGMGILHFFLARPSMPVFLRFLLTLVFVILIFSPVINAVLLGGIVLLGIAENWAPFRALKQNGPPSTPEAGDGGS